MTNLLKTSAIALTAVVGFAAAAAPAFADTWSNGYNPSFELTQLHYQGVNATAVDRVTDGVIRATVVSNGHTSFEFFDTDTLTQIK